MLPTVQLSASAMSQHQAEGSTTNLPPLRRRVETTVDGKECGRQLLGDAGGVPIPPRYGVFDPIKSEWQVEPKDPKIAASPDMNIPQVFSSLLLAHANESKLLAQLNSTPVLLAPGETNELRKTSWHFPGRAS